MIRRRLGGSQLAAALLVIVCGSFASYAFGHALGQRPAGGASMPSARVGTITGQLGQAALGVRTQSQIVPKVTAPPRAAPPAAAPSHSLADARHKNEGKSKGHSDDKEDHRGGKHGGDGHGGNGHGG